MNAHDPTNTESDPYPHNDIDRHLQSHARFARAASSPEVIAAAQFLLQQPDAYLHRRRYLELIVDTTDSDGTPDHRLHRCRKISAHRVQKNSSIRYRASESERITHRRLLERTIMGLNGSTPASAQHESSGGNGPPPSSRCL